MPRLTPDELRKEINREYDRMMLLAFPEKRKIRVLKTTRYRQTPNGREKTRAYKKLYYMRPDKLEIKRATARRWSLADYHSNPARKARGIAWRKSPAGKAYYSSYSKIRSAVDEVYALKRRIQSRVASAVKSIKAKKLASTSDLLGCSTEHYKWFIEKKFLPGMTWLNHGKGAGTWQIDHINPITSFDLKDEEQQRRCFHFSNTQPLWFLDNIRKGNKICLT